MLLLFTVHIWRPRDSAGYLFWVVGHRVDVLKYMSRFSRCVPEAVRAEVSASNPRYPHWVYGYQELFRSLEAQGVPAAHNPSQCVPQFHTGEAAALALACDEGWWLIFVTQSPSP